METTKRTPEAMHKLMAQAGARADRRAAAAGIDVVAAFCGAVEATPLLLEAIELYEALEEIDEATR